MAQQRITKNKKLENMFYNETHLMVTDIFDLVMRQHVEYDICIAAVKSVNYLIPHYQKLLPGIGLK